MATVCGQSPTLAQLAPLGCIEHLFYYPGSVNDALRPTRRSPLRRRRRPGGIDRDLQADHAAHRLPAVAESGPVASSDRTCSGPGSLGLAELAARHALVEVLCALELVGRDSIWVVVTRAIVNPRLGVSWKRLKSQTRAVIRSPPNMLRILNGAGVVASCQARSCQPE